MLKIVHTILDILFPPRPSELCIRTTPIEIITGLLNPRRHEDIIYLLTYQNPIITALITENKFHHNEDAAKYLALVLTTWLDANHMDATLIPIPLSQKRKKTRGYNQVEEITKQLPRTWRARVDTSLLLRTRHTEAQTTLTRADRLHNMTGAFTVSRKNSTRTVPIIIIDDVVTTGATLQAAKAAVQKSNPNAHIILLSLAH